MARDPVCGRAVDEKKAGASTEYQGRNYYFCFIGCKKAFDASPQKYVKNTSVAGSIFRHRQS